MAILLRMAGVVVFATLLALAAKPEIQVVRDCLLSIALSDRAECHGADVEHMTCTGILVTKRKNCEMLKAK